LPIDTQLIAVTTHGPRPLADYLAGLAGRGQGAAGAPGPIVVPVQDAESAGIDSYLGAPAAEVIARCEATGNAGDLTSAVIGAGGVPGPFLFLGLGDGSPAAMRKAGAAVGRRVAPGQTLVTSALLGRPAAAAHAFTVGLLLGSYHWSQERDEAGHSEPPGEVRLLLDGPDGHPDAIAAASTVAGAVALARDLTNTPSARKTPAWLAGQAAAVAASAGLTIRVWDADELAAQGFGGLIAVGSGSASPPRLIELGYAPAGARRHIVLADLAGGAAVIAAMSALGRLGVASRVTGLVAAAENMPSGSALRPGDVITHFGGRTVEVLNTDAEGRLVLADALAYADAVLQPDAVVDIATLTGSARVALGTHQAALYATDERLARDLLAAADASGDALWRMPLVDDYRDALDSPVADLANVPHGSRARAGSIDAALFLREFTGGRPWAHLDIAGAARSSSDDGENTKGGTGYGTRLLLAWLAARGPLNDGVHSVF